MAFQKNDDYNEVKDRIREFKKAHPGGRLQSEIVETGIAGFIAVKAYAYRTHQDTLPGVGLAWEPVPGRTPYTKDSELQNAETSAWGRALIAALIADTSKGIASADDVRNRRSVEAAPQSGPKTQGDADKKAAIPTPSAAASAPSPVEAARHGSSTGDIVGEVASETTGEGVTEAASPASAEKDHPHEWIEGKVSKWLVCADSDCFATKKKSEVSA